ncbi:hypothetical protein A9Q87_10025 [Flavobacteriales bacterium 34_180_T64]|nr:hypothetical protein A9Q87_10025 [Flavobacteriales bacterium 34_180_T64]
MKNLTVVLMLFSVAFVNAQAYKGKGDTKFQIGVNFQNGASGINASYDIGVGENISFGLSSTYLLGVDDKLNASFGDRFDIKARFNANIGNVVNIDDNFDMYPGLNFSLKNFGGHLGLRYFFTTGFGVFTEMNAPISKYNSGALTPAEKLHNQFSVNLGAIFNL